jgi:hypothetical protein
MEKTAGAPQKGVASRRQVEGVMAIENFTALQQHGKSSPASLNVESLGLAMTDQSFNRTFQKTQAKKDNEKFTPVLKQDYLHDFTLSRKNDYGTWADNEGKKLGFSDHGDVQQINAFRHALTAAIYTIKYGENVTSSVGWMNEQKNFNIFSSLAGEINLAKIADTNADLLNNQSGIKIAEELIEEKGKQNITIADIEKRVSDEVKAEELSVHPMQELKTGRLATEHLSYHSMPGLIIWESKYGPTAKDRAAAAKIVENRHL